MIQIDGQVLDGPGQPAVAVVEGVDGDEPEMGYSRAHDPLLVSPALVKPLQEESHLAIREPCSTSYQPSRLSSGFDQARFFS